MFKYLKLLFILFASVASAQPSTYFEEVEQFRRQRETEFTKDTSPLNLIDLIWLNEGSNTVGSGLQNKIIFPQGKCPKEIGTLFLKDGVVELTVNKKAEVTAHEKPFKSGIIFQEKYPDSTIVLDCNKLRFYIIKRGFRYAVRLRDMENELFKNFSHLNYFPIDEGWKFQARFEPAATPVKLFYNDKHGNTTTNNLAGWIVFEHNNREFRLEATNLNDSLLFVSFSDNTAGGATYSGGRYLEVAKPTVRDMVTLDFNKCYNPDCAYTIYATCPLPKKENFLPFEIFAGEKEYLSH